MYYKIHDRRNFYSTLCQTAKRNQRYNLIQSTQNDSTSVEHNFKTLAQNKFNTRQPIQNLKGHVLRPNQITFARVISLVVSNYLSPIYFVSFSWSSPLSFFRLSLRFGERIYRQTPRDCELTRINQIILQPSRDYAYARTT